MAILWNGIKVGFFLMLTVGLLFASGLFSVLLYGKLTGKEWMFDAARDGSPVVFAEASADADKPDIDNADIDNPNTDEPEKTEAPKKSAVLLEAPAIRQFPELHSGCEVTSLAMLLQFAGVKVGKLDLVPEMDQDETPLRFADDGSIASWGNPNTGFVGDITGESKGFGIYHGPLLKLLQAYIPSGFDLTGQSFDDIERQVSSGVPVIAWTTIDFNMPARWVVWDTPLGPIRTTFMEHAVLLVGYDETRVYVNDPWSGKAQYAIDKKRFIDTWEAMGRQAISYAGPEEG